MPTTSPPPSPRSIQVIPNPDPQPHGSVWVIPCDPPALQIEKVADPQVCTKAPGGFECSYDVKVTSVGKDPYHGTLEIDEIIPAGSTLKSFSAPWKCAGAAPAAHCSHPFVDLDPGTPDDFRELKVTIAVPDSFATSGQCAITNEVHTSVAAAVLHSDKAAQYMAKATAKIPADACGKPANVCPITQRMPNGGCCPEDQRWNGFACRPLVVSKCPAGTTGKPPKCKPIVVTCPAGTDRAPPPNCKPIVVTQCPAGSVGVYPDCRCPDGTTGTPPNCKPIVVTRCPAGSVGVYPDCRCPDGTTGTPPNCKPIVVACPAGSVGTYPDCHCPTGTTGTPPNCKPIVMPGGLGRHLSQLPLPRRHDRHTAQLQADRYARRVRSAPIPTATAQTARRARRPTASRSFTCPAGSVGIYPNCRCPTGTTRHAAQLQANRYARRARSAPIPTATAQRAPRARRPTASQSLCPAGSVGTYPNCHCPTGTTGTPPNCKPIVVQRCPAGSVGVYPRCLCPGGFRGTPPNCVAIPKIVPRTCPAGQHLTEAGRCAADEGKP